MLLFLVACGKEDIPLLAKDNYELKGVEKNKNLNNYLEKLMDDRLSQPMEAGEGDEERQRRIDYRRRMVSDDLKKGLEAQGYYDGQVRFEAKSTKKDKGSFVITPGTQYKIANIRIKPKRFADLKKAITVKEGDPLNASMVLGAREQMAKEIDKDHCLLNLEIDHTVLLDPVRHQADVTYMIRSGGDAVYGRVKFEGLDRVHEKYLRRQIGWKEGDCFKRTEIEKFRTELLQSGLFTTVDVKTPESVPRGAAAPITFVMKERAHRTLSAGLRYYTDEGPGLLLGWENRNFSGNAEKVTANLQLSTLKKSLDTSYTKPLFGRKGQSLTLTGSITDEDTDAYDQTGLKLGAAIERKLTNRLTGSVGINGMFSKVDDRLTNQENTFGLVSFPVGLTYDSRNNLLDPTSGINASAQVAPFLDVLGESSPFIKSRATVSTYFGFGKSDKLVLALRGSLGSITGANTADIPASERFYAGGGGSIRGFGYQDVGPFTAGSPSGGRSIIETNTELRFKFSDTIGAVAFVDAGNVGNNTMPDMDNLSIGVGTGLRYYTDFGPLRFDIATPLTEKSNTQNYQFYISIGQAF